MIGLGSGKNESEHHAFFCFTFSLALVFPSSSANGDGYIRGSRLLLPFLISFLIVNTFQNQKTRLLHEVHLPEKWEWDKYVTDKAEFA